MLYIEDTTQLREDMDFMFEWQEQYLTSERSERENTAIRNIFRMAYYMTLYDIQKIHHSDPECSDMDSASV